MLHFFHKYLIICLLAVVFAIAGSCKKNRDVVPNVFVNQYIHINNPTNYKLNAIGGWIYLSGGVRGIILYRKSTEEFAAYERNCSWQPLDACSTLSVDSSNVNVSDNCCGSQFVILDGSIIKGPATIPMRQYQTTFDGNTVHVFN